MSKGSGIIDSSRVRIPATNGPAVDTSAAGADLLPVAVFADFGVSAPIIDMLRDRGITHPFSIQALALPVTLRGNGIIGQTKTGTGRMLDFNVSMLEDITGIGGEGRELVPVQARGKPQGLVVLLTCGLAKQVAEELHAATVRRRLHTVEVYGERVYEPRQETLREGAEIVVGTPGRLVDLMKHRFFDLIYVRTVILDEANEMLGLDFLEDVEKTLVLTPSNRHTMFLPATMPGSIVTMTRWYMSRPTHICVTGPSDTGMTVGSVHQMVYRYHILNKSEVLAHILQAKGRDLTIASTWTR